MAIKKDKKAEILSDLSSIIDASNTLVFVGFNTLSVKDTTEARRELGKEGIGYRVVKKTLLKRAVADKKFNGTIDVLPGNIALVYGEDAIAPARLIHEFSKKWKDKLSIEGGVFEGSVKTAIEMKEIATIPSLHVLRGMFVNVINSPIQGFVIALDAIAKTKE